MILIWLFGVLAINGINASDQTKIDLFDSIVMKDGADIAKITDDYIDSLESELINYLDNGNVSKNFGNLRYQLKQFRDGNGLEFYKCVTCRASVNVFIRTFRKARHTLDEPSKKALGQRFITFYCENIDIEAEEVCIPLFNLHLPYIEYITANSVMSSKTVCGITTKSSFCEVDQIEYNWSIQIDTKDPQLIGSKSKIPDKGTDDLIILHLTDIHYSPLYEPGNLAECGKPLCCRYKGDIAKDPSKGAGKWSDYRTCDTPWEMFTDAIRQIKINHPKIDFIYITGDIIDHAVWETSKDDNMEYLGEVYSYLKEAFGDIPVYPIIGNHEPHPLDLFNPSGVPKELNVVWLYEHLIELWSDWLPDDTKETMLLGGYYTVSPYPGFRIIALNSNECYIRNWWIFYDGSHLSKQLQWLHDTLLAAEQNKEYVHILSHVPSGQECWTIWSREFNRIVERFAKTISGIFNGHTHVDEFSVYYTKNDPPKPINIAWNGGSLTTFINKNPNYRIYEIEKTSLQVVEHHTWIFNLTEANQHPDRRPRWFKEYTFGEEFNLKNLSPASVDEFLTKLSENPPLMRKYWQYQATMADPQLKAGCNEKCLLRHICLLATSYPERLDRCVELQENLRKSLERERLQEKGTECE